MTIEQMLTISKRAAAICGAGLYGEPKLENGSWIVGFKQNKETMALQVCFTDRDIAGDNELYKAEIELEQRMQTAILMS